MFATEFAPMETDSAMSSGSTDDSTADQNYTTRTVPALDIDAYAQKVYQANRSAAL